MEASVNFLVKLCRPFTCFTTQTSRNYSQGRRIGNNCDFDTGRRRRLRRGCAGKRATLHTAREPCYESEPMAPARAMPQERGRAGRRAAFRSGKRAVRARNVVRGEAARADRRLCERDPINPLRERLRCKSKPTYHAREWRHYLSKGHFAKVKYRIRKRHFP